MILLLHSGSVNEVLGSLSAGVHVGQLELGILELAQAATKLDTLLGVLDSLVDGAFGKTESLGGDTDTAAVEGLHGDLEAFAFLTEQVLLGDDAVFEDEVAGRAAADTHLLLVLTGGEAGEVLLNDEGGDTVVALALVGHGEHDESGGNVTVGDEALAAVEDVVAVLVLDSGGLLAGGVGTGAGLGQTERADLAAGQKVRQILHLLFLGAVLENGSAAEGGVGGNDNSGGAANLSELLHAHGITENIAAGAAVLLREVNTHHAELGHLFDGLHGEALFLIEFLS